MKNYNNIFSQVTSQPSLLVRHYSEEAVVYNANSAETHLLAADIGRLLELIISGCRDAQSLQATVSGLHTEASPDELLQEYLGALEQLGLISYSRTKET